MSRLPAVPKSTPVPQGQRIRRLTHEDLFNRLHAAYTKGYDQGVAQASAHASQAFEELFAAGAITDRELAIEVLKRCRQKSS